MKINISEKKGELSFGVIWISIDGRLTTNWFRLLKEAKAQYNHLLFLERQPTILVRLENKLLKGKKIYLEKMIKRRTK